MYTDIERFIMRYLCIQNPKSGQRAIQRNMMRVVERLKSEGHQVEVLNTESEGDAQKFAQACISMPSIDLIVVIGGDGTVNEAVNGLYLNGERDGARHSLAPLAIIPAGTVNDFANHFKLPYKENAIFNYLNHFQSTRVDIGEVNGKYFTNVVAAGYISDVGYKVQRKHKKRFGRLAYYVEGTIEAIKYLKHSNRFTFKISEHEVALDAYMFIALNTTYLGGLSYFAPTANCEDGFLDLIIIKKTGLIGGFLLLIKILLGKHIDDKNVIYFKTKGFQVDANRPLDVDIDGEKGTQLPLDIRVKKQFVNLAVPISDGV